MISTSSPTLTGSFSKDLSAVTLIPLIFTTTSSRLPLKITSSTIPFSDALIYRFNSPFFANSRNSGLTIAFCARSIFSNPFKDS